VGVLGSLFRRRRLPAARRPKLSDQERVIAWASATDDDVLVATNHGLWLPGGAARLGWHEIHKATWSGRQLAIVAAEAVRDEGGYVVMADRPAIVLTLLDPDRLPEQVRARVTRSVVYTTHHALPGGGGVRVVGRKVGGVDGVRWTVRYDQLEHAEEPAVAAATAELVEQARASTLSP
jgi:hypothetical protein